MFSLPVDVSLAPTEFSSDTGGGLSLSFAPMEKPVGGRTSSSDANPVTFASLMTGLIPPNSEQGPFVEMIEPDVEESANEGIPPQPETGSTPSANQMVRFFGIAGSIETEVEEPDVTVVPMESEIAVDKPVEPVAQRVVEEGASETNFQESSNPVKSTRSQAAPPMASRPEIRRDADMVAVETDDEASAHTVAAEPKATASQAQAMNKDESTVTVKEASQPARPLVESATPIAVHTDKPASIQSGDGVETRPKSAEQLPNETNASNESRPSLTADNQEMSLAKAPKEPTQVVRSKQPSTNSNVREGLTTPTGIQPELNSEKSSGSSPESDRAPESGDEIRSEVNLPAGKLESNVGSTLTTPASDRQGPIRLEGLQSNDSEKVTEATIAALSNTKVVESPVQHATPAPAMVSPSKAEISIGKGPEASGSQLDVEDDSVEMNDSSNEGFESSEDDAAPRNKPDRQFSQGETENPARPSSDNPTRVVRSGRETGLLAGKTIENEEVLTGEERPDESGTRTAKEESRMAEPDQKVFTNYSMSDSPKSDSVRLDAANREQGILKEESAVAPVVSPLEVSGARQAARADAGSNVTVPSTYEAAVANAERISQMIVRESATLRHTGAQSMSVVLRPDENTELVVNLTKVDGTLEAVIKLERGEFGGLNQHWVQLQDRLAQQNIRLGALNESELRSSSSEKEGDEPSNESRHSDEDPTDTRRAANTMSRVKGEGGEKGGIEATHDKPITAEKGKWETWA